MPREPLSESELSAVERSAFGTRIEIFAASRRAASTLARNQLRSSSEAGDLRQTAARIATSVDEAIAIVRDRFTPRLDCREGCSACCRRPGVLVSIPELLLLLDRVRRTFDAAQRLALADRAAEYAHIVEAAQSACVSVPCPLLVNDRCSVYDSRPLVCRGYNSTDVRGCLEAEREGTAAVPIFAPIKDASDGSSVGLARALADSGASPALVDLGSALNYVLSTGLTEDAIATGAHLAPIENRELLPALSARVNELAAELGIDAGEA